MIMKALKWRLSPLTIVSWLNVYVQVAYVNDTGEVLMIGLFLSAIEVDVRNTQVAQAPRASQKLLQSWQ